LPKSENFLILEHTWRKRSLLRRTPALTVTSVSIAARRAAACACLRNARDGKKILQKGFTSPFSGHTEADLDKTGDDKK